MKKQENKKNKSQPISQYRTRKLIVEEETTLLPFLLSKIKNRSRSAIKLLLKHKMIMVNEKVQSQFNLVLSQGDEVRICAGNQCPPLNHPLIKIIYEDEYIVVVNKRQGLLAVSTDRVKVRTAYHILREYYQKAHLRHNIYVVHRLDRDTSGVMMFAKSEEVQRELQYQWDKYVTKRGYVAIVEGRPEKERDTLVTQLKENAKMQVFVVPTGGKTAITHYRVLCTTGKYSLVEFELETGRKNQIRAHMQYIGHPIAGDTKYGAETDPAHRLMLHAQKLYFIHPVTGEEMHFEVRLPNTFKSIINNYEQIIQEP